VLVAASGAVGEPATEGELEALLKSNVGEVLAVAVCVAHSVDVALPEPELVSVGEEESDRPALPVGTPVIEGVAEPQGDTDADGCTEALPLPPVGDAETHTVPEGERCAVTVAVGDADAEEQGESVLAPVPVIVVVRVATEVRDTEPQMVPEGETESESEKEAERDAPPVAVPAAATRVGDTEALPDKEPVKLEPGEGLVEGEALTLGHAVSEGGMETLPDTETERVPALVWEGALLSVTIGEALCAALSVALGEEEPVDVREPAPRRPGPPPAEGDPLPLFEPVGTAVALTPVEGDWLNVVLTVNVVVTEAVDEMLCVTEADGDSDTVADMEGDAVPQKEAVPESERLPEAHAVSLGAAVPVFSADREGVPLALARGVPEPVGTAVPLLVREGGALVAVAPSEGLSRGDEEPQTEGGGDSDAAPLAERVAGGERVLAAHATVGVATAVTLGEPLCVGVKVARGEAEEDTVAVPDAEAEGEPVVDSV
jgi:hypothetical protein